ncbi:non-ribosomal peptide synthase/polyketide synthase [Myxococcus sp. RHSTA-1-4]|uniref:non-ribosomal peptide synthase/polyketide synthase n=1 Tax=Myxococcus sp. RHSTA-1-4 TaxID=2874601 RepID=UPI001CBC24FC|nr:non-ribosomal peptide synthetase [Myxococcus sp. RHSTA-1-4]MBZ4419892.1 non-ribosomal peptide synthase/polyketide synthase [Myxococcus sp. RHSTA-1-4]
MSDNIEDLYPLSPLQGGMLFHAIAEPGQGLYFNQLVCELRGRLDLGAFTRAWQGTVAAHPVLRTALVWDDVDEPVQVVLHEVDLPLRTEDWRDLSPEARDARLAAFLEQDRRDGFDLSRAPLVRLTLLRTADEAHRLVFSHSHLVLDGWSVPLVLRDVFALYEGTLAGRPPRLASPRPFRDYIGWLAERDLAVTEAFWRRELAGFHEPTPTGAGQGEGQGRATRVLHLPSDTTAALNAFARRHGLTASTLVQGAWAMVLGHVSGSEDVVFGTTVSGRPPDLAGVEDMVGLFINTQPVRVRLSPDEPWLEWLRRIQEVQVEARQHEHAPLVKVQRWSGVPAGTPLFDTLVVFENYPLDAALTSASRALEVRDVSAVETDHFALTLIASNGTRLPLHLRYDRTRFTEAFADAQLERLRRVLEALVARPEGRLGELPLLSEAERHQLLVAWNDTRTDFPDRATVHGLFQEQVARTPDAVAVSMGDTRLTFRELDARSNQLAHYLRGRDVRPGTLVGLCFRRSPDMVVALWAVLKAGGAYVPIDPAWPASRLSFLMEDTGVPVLLTEKALASTLPVSSRVLLCVDSEWERTAEREPVTPPEPLATAGDLAYLIYTSGSTGRPKGVMVEHRGVVNYLCWALRAYGITEGSGSPVHSPLSFDLTVTSLIAPLVAGRPVVLVPEEAGVEGLGEALRAGSHFSLVKLTPTHLRMLAQQLRPDEAAGRARAFVIGGEALTAEGVAFWREHAPDTRLINEYGPTETVVGCCVYTVSAADPASGPVAIGRPIANTRLYVLDAHLRPVPVGVPGELFIGGTGVARGYWRRPELTAERFIPDAFGTEPGARLYRTGDRVRWRADGRLEYLGRTDFQVKVRGYRIELGEIESALRTHPSVGDAVAVVRDDSPSGARLVAYVVPPGAEGSTAKPDAAVLRAFLGERLPEYMVPSAIVALEAFPLSANGKVERRALPAPGYAMEVTEAYVGPRDAKEDALAAVWAQVLGRPRVGIHEDFFELGGDSILGIQVISRAAQAGLHLTAKQLFEHRTVARLAAVAAEASSVKVEQGPVTGPVELTPIQRWFFERELPEPHHFNQALRFILRERVRVEHLERALQHLREHHDTLRLRFRRDGQGGWYQELGGLEGTLPLETVDLSGLTPDARRAAVVSHATSAQAGLDLTTGDLARAVLFDSGPEAPQELLLVVHHLAVDAVSWRVLLEDLLTAYRQLRADEPVRLPPKTLSFQAWASRLVEHARSHAAREEADFWLGLPWERVARLPVDVEAGAANTEGASRMVEVALEAAETQALLHDVAKACRARPDELLLGALAHVLRRWTGAPCVRVEMEGHGREDLFEGVDLSRTVGWFTSIYPVLVDPDGVGPGAWLRSAKEALRRIPGRGVGYGVLRYLSPDPVLRERLSALPPPEVGFNYLGQLDHVLPATAPLALSDGSVGPTRAPGGKRAHLLDVDCAVTGGRMRLMLTYGTGVHRAETVERLAHELLGALRELIAQGTSEDPRGLAPSDFPLAKLGQGELDALADRLAAKGGRLRDVEDLYPLAPLQQGILFHHLQEDETQPYFNQLAFEVDGGLDVKAFTEAWRQTAMQFSILRTAFFWEGLDAPLQAVMREVEPSVTVEDWRSVAPADLEARVAAFFAEDRRRGVVLTRAPLFRLTLLRTGERVWRVVFSVTHLLLDGWSTQLVTRDVFTRYEALRRGLTPPRRDVRPYRDYIAWLGRQDLGAARKFWRKALADFTEPTRVDVGGASRAPAGRGEQELRLATEETAALVAFARQQGVTPGTLLQAAWALLLGRYSGRDDVLFGLTVSGRPPELPGIEGMVGMFINAIPVRVRLPPSQAVGPWLKALQGWLQEARQYEVAPLVEVRRWSEVPPGPPLFESLFIYENYPMEAALSTPSDELVVRNPSSVEVDHHPLTLMAVPGRELLLKLTYDSARFDAAAVRGMLGHVRQLLGELRGKAGQPLSELSLLGAEERRRVLVEWNDTAREPPPRVPVHRPVEAQATRTPDAVAVTDGTHSLTYAELDSRANRLAHHLVSLGVPGGGTVGLCLDKSLDMAVAVLAALKAGAACLPLDPNYPSERLAFMLEDSGAPVVLTQSHLASSLYVDLGAHRVCVDTEASAIARHPAHAVARELPPEATCYLIYTSGSTGQPKGVALPHRALSNLLAWQLRQSVNPAATTLQFAALSFDVSFQEMFSTWWAGGTLVLPTGGLRQDMPALLDFMDRTGVERMFLPFVALQAMADAATHGATVPRALREVVTAGEQLQVTSALVAFFEKLPGCVLENQYGPSETHVVSAHRLQGAPSTWPRLPSIGGPLPHCQLHVLDPYGQPCPVGVPGELFLGGTHLAHGYAGRPGLTAEKFVPHPFSGVPGARLYRTGDLARWKSDGTVEFLGRLDGQVKLRGFRVETGEVEAALRAYEDVRDAAAVVREDVPGDRRLVGYLVLAVPPDALDLESLRAFLQQRLPEYMVPSAFVTLEALPLTPSGKVNRKALPRPDLGAGGREDFEPPRTATEEVLAGLFAEVLGLEKVGRNGHFFELGGHSLMATRAVSRLRGAFGIELPLRELFEAPTVAALASRIERLTHAGTSLTAPPLVPRADRTSAPPLSFAQQRLWFLDQFEPGSAAYNMPAAVRLRGPLETQALERSFRELVRRHESLRTTFRAEDGVAVQVISPEPVVSFRPVEPGSREEAWRQVEQEVARPFDLSRGPLLRTTLLKLAPEDHILVLVMHHIVSDGWSTGVLVREVAALYDAFSQGLPSPLPELPVQYADYAVWQRGWLQGEVLEAQLDYWRKQLEGAARALELPTDRPRPAAQTFRGGFRKQTWPKALWRQVEALSRREGATPFMVLLAAYQAVLSRYSGQEDLCVGSPIAGRTHAETEGLIGFFANTLVLRSRVRPEASFLELLAQVRDVTLGAYAHQDVPFEKLVEALLPERDLSHGPLFQVSLALQNTPLPEMKLRKGLSLTGMEPDTRTSKFDFSLAVEEVPEGVLAELNYNSDLFEPETADRLLGHVRVLLEAAAAEPRRPLSLLPLMGAEEQRRLVEEWSGRTAAYPREQSLAELFEAQALETPQAVAVEYEGLRLTYAELNGRANQLAHHLMRMGVGAEERVGLCLERSLELVVGVLGILKAGAAYVPLDASYPRERLGWMKREAGVAVLVAREKLAEVVGGGGERVVCVDTEWDAIARQPESNPPSRVGGGNLAYVMFTSGSTGRPKGVGVPHRAVTRLVVGTDCARFGPEEVWLQLAPISFDASTLELWGALLHGAKLVVYPAGTPSLEELGRKLEEAGVTSLWLTAALFEQVQAHQPSALSRVKQVLAGGDVLPPARVRERLAAGGVLINGYGPTENTTFSTTHRMDTPDAGGTRSVPIGRPIVNTTAYVLDAAMQPVPVGVPGELYVGGDGLAVGYVGRPELTAERFVPNPFGRGERLYRTGDRVRWRGDGTLEFLGRADNQVKVRGFRIEPGEVEAALRRQGREAVVVVREDTPGDKRLVAYVVAPEAGAAAIQEALRQTLPEYMVPSAVVPLEVLPLTPNGKVDRRALPAPDSRPSAQREYLAPRAGTEQALAALWSEVLGGEQPGRDEDFFALGGHSLLATRLISRIRASLGVELPLRTLFESPTLEALATRIDAARRDGSASEAPPLVPVPRTESLPLSFAQHRLWFFDQLTPGSAAYNIPISMLVEGTPRLDALRQAFSVLVARHESLRTTFAVHEGQPVQVIHAPADFPLSVEDLSALPEAGRRDAARRRAVQEALRPFDLGRGPLLRACLLRLAPEEHVLVLVMHHIISDGWSMGVLVRELGALYAVFSEGLPSPLPALTVQYADYAVWQRQWLSGGPMEAQLGWWKQRLAGAPPHLELPTDKPRPAVLSHQGATVPVRLPRALSDALTALAQREGATPFMVLLAGFQVLLARYSGQEDISVGSPIAGRTRAETEGLIGFFVNTLVMRAQVRPRATFRELLAQVRESTLGAYEHQDLPFEKLVEALQPARDLSRSALFQVLFVLQNAPVEALALPSLSLKPLEVEGTESARFELTLNLGETPDGFAGILLFNTDLFTRGTAARMVDHLQVLLESVTTNPDPRLSELPLMTPAERQQVLRAWNDTAADFPRDVSIHRLFEQQALRTPDAPAVRFEDSVLTFARLDARANRLAHWLRSRGVGPEACVALCLERGVDMVVAVLGILKAGGAYVPMDPASPRERLVFMLQDCGARLVLTWRDLASRFEGSSAEAVCLDDPRITESLARESEGPPPHVTSPEHLAYVIYTSGSTGTPKGVMVRHRSVLNLRHALARTVYAGQPSGLRVSVNAPLAFDASVKQLVQLLDGHCLCIVPDATRQDPDAMLAWLHRHRVDVLDCTPSLLRLLVRSGMLLAGSAPRLLVPGGEAIDDALWQQLAAAPRTRTFNVYGPTECTVDSTASVVRPETRPTIGGPLANVQVYVLDAWLRPVPVGVPGELFISGEGLARGYLRRPELTAERFLPDAFSTTPGARMYRTGDKVRWLADGTLDYLGRTDFQVKLRGFRIELGEIEAALTLHPAVRQALVLSREDVPGIPRLVAYVVVAPGAAVEAEALRASLKQRLPEYMVPTAFVPMEAFPLTSNGKVDREALPAPDASALATAHVYEPPGTAMEETLAALWAEVLRVERVGRRDDFFALGGHSLLATQVVARLRAVLGVEVPLRTLFEAPTLGALALRVEQASRSLVLPPLRPVPREGALPLSFAQQRLWFLDQLQPGGTAYNMPAVFRLEGTLDVAALERAFTELVRRHESLRTTFRDDGGTPVQVIHPAAPFPLPVVDLTGREDREAEALRLATEAVRPFDLSTGPLLRASLLRLAGDAHVLLLDMHHIVSDGWSIGVLVRELAALYHAFSTGQSSPLPPLPLQYADVAVWQRSWMRGEALDAQLTWWREHLEGAPHALELPTDFARPPVRSFRGASVPVRLSRPLSDALRAFCREQAVTPFMALLGAFQALLSRYSGQDDFVVGSPIAGRRFAELEGLIGFFVNTLALRARLGGRPSFQELVARVREATLGAQAHQDIPFEKLVESLASGRSLERSPLFQVFFTLHNAPRSALAGEGLSIRPVEVKNPTAKFDLELALSELPEGFSGQLIYNADLFLPATAQRLAQGFTHFLETLLGRPRQPVHTLPLLSGDALRSVLAGFNRAPEDFPADETMTGVFARVAAARADAVAVEFGSRRLTYAQLDAASSQLAHLLVARGVRPDAPVALALERSMELIVSLLAILKAGGAYLPLDTSYPRERLDAMLEDARPVLLLTSSAHLGSVPAPESLPVLLMDGVQEALRAQPAHAPTVALSPQHLAYIDFTSGSTGRPRGVAITHRAVLRTVCNAPYADLSADESFLLIAPISFDASTLEVWGPLLNGGRLVVFPPTSPGDLDQLSTVLQEHSVTTLHLTAGLFSQMVDSHLRGLRGVRQLLTGGDVISAPHVRRVLDTLRIPVTACYGPTESTLFTSCFRMTSSAQVPGAVPIGTPITATRVYLLDASMQPVPVGVPGELFIAGEGLARGYVRSPAPTAERFVPNPFASEPGARMYRTGDLARWRPDGVLEFLGRKDFQVKVRGFRVELAEVEAALLAFPGVREAVALAREDVPGDKRLVGYAAAEPSLDLGALRAHLQRRLPEYMVPSALVRLDALPLTANAKVDRKALPAPDARVASRPFVPPRTLTEQRLAALWAQVLRVEKVGVHDDFFELGGHSLLATQVVARVRAELGVDLPLRALFEAPTVERLASWLEGARHDGPERHCVTLQPEGTNTPVFFVHAVGGAVGPYRELARRLGPGRPFHGFQAAGMDGREPPLESVEALARRYVEAVRAVRPEGPYVLGGWSMGGVVAFEMARELERQGQRVELLVLLDSFAPADEVPVREPEGALLLAGMAMDLARTAGMEPTLRPELLADLSEDEQLARVARHAREAGWLPPEVEEADLRAWRDVMRANMRAFAAYQPGDYGGPVLLLRAKDTKRAHAVDATHGWSRWVKSRLTVRDVPGDHYSVLRAPHVDTLAARLAEYLEGAAEDGDRREEG